MAQAHKGSCCFLCGVDVSSELFMTKIDSSTMSVFNVSFHLDTPSSELECLSIKTHFTIIIQRLLEKAN